MANGVSSRSHAILQLSLCVPAAPKPTGRFNGRAAALAAAAGDELKVSMYFCFILLEKLSVYRVAY